MLTVLNSLELSAEYLKKKNVESPRLNAEILLAHILNCKRMELYLNFDRPLTEDERITYRGYIKRRGEREPFQYIIGFAEFYGLKLKVNRDVLIPRPETELLVEEIIKRENKSGFLSILDIGTGSGNISLALLNNLPEARIHSIDISQNAISIAEENASSYNLNDRIILEAISFDDFLEKNISKFDIIVSNPPYVSLQDYTALDKELLDYEPEIALTDKNNGISFYTNISMKSKEILKKEGRLYFELGFSQSQRVREIMIENGFSNIKIAKDYQNIDRIIAGELN